MKARPPLSRDLSKVMAAAFKRAEQWRADKGLPPRAVTHQAPDGRVFSGPKRYKVTLWLTPWEYLDLLEAMRHAGFRGSLRKFIVTRSGDQVVTATPHKGRRLRAVG